MELDISINYVAAYLRHKRSSIISVNKSVKKSSDKKPKIQLKLSDIYIIEIPIVSAKVQRDIDKLSKEATSLLKQSLDKMKEIEGLIKGY